MDWLNYHHLLYFWTTARAGSIAAAASQLHLSQPTLSSQIKKLERSLGLALFQRRGRTLELTEMGQIAYRYADEIFGLGQELLDALRGRPVGGALRFVVGIPDVVPKLIVHRLLAPVLEMPEPVHLVTYEGKFDQLLADLALHKLDVVLAENPLPPTASVRAFSHPLGECTTCFLATPGLAARHRQDFPTSLNGAPMLLPTQNTAARRALEQWFDRHHVRPAVQHEFEDSALLKVFGQAGAGLFPSPSAIAAEVCRQYAVEWVGEAAEVRQSYYAISVERRLQHPAVIAIAHAAREGLDASHRGGRLAAE